VPPGQRGDRPASWLGHARARTSPSAWNVSAARRFEFGRPATLRVAVRAARAHVSEAPPPTHALATPRRAPRVNATSQAPGADLTACRSADSRQCHRPDESASGAPGRASRRVGARELSVERGRPGLPVSGTRRDRG
jgi:transposase-like protein